MAKTRPVLTDEQREQQRAQQRELVIASIEQLRTSDGWQAYLRARARFPSYSWLNVLLILSQHPTAERVAGFRAWLELGYCVTKGSTGIRIWARCAPSPQRMRAWRDAGANPNDRPRAAYKLVSVFDRISRVRSGDVADARVGLRFPAGISLLVCAPGFMREGTGFRLARASRRYPANRRVISRCECRHRVPKPGS